MKTLGTYICDKGSLVVNGLCIRNGIGDGEFNIYYFEDEDDAKLNGFEEVSDDFWIDLRNSDVKIWEYDCDSKCEKITLTQNAINAKALKLFRNEEGDFAFVKYF